MIIYLIYITVNKIWWKMIKKWIKLWKTLNKGAYTNEVYLRMVAKEINEI